jgi:hypothetical protein
VLRWQVAAGLISGQVKQCSRRRKLVRVTPVMRLGTEDALTAARPRMRLLWTIEHGLDFAGQSDDPPWTSRAGSSHLGEACPTPAGLPGMVACLLSFCASSRSAACSSPAASRTRGQTSRTTRPPTDASSGCRQNHLAMERARGTRLPRAFGFRLRGIEARWGAVSYR